MGVWQHVMLKQSFDGEIWRKEVILST